MSLPKFSVVMATLNSMRTLETALKALKKQNYPSELVEILVIDGGSTDGTRATAERYGCRIIDNPKVDPVNAKLLGLREASGEYLMHVDSDEELLSPETLRHHASVYLDNPQVRIVFSTGYVDPTGAPFAARYINEYGDPFSMYFYRLSKSFRFFPKQILHFCRTVKQNEYSLILELNSEQQPILENAACANSIDLKFFKKEFPDLCDKPWGPVHFFYHMQKLTKLFAVTLKDPVCHHSADHMRGFLNKIKWRIRNNVFSIHDLGSAGFSGRVQFDSFGAKLRRFGFIPYTFLLFPVILDSVYHMWTRRDFAYWQHTPLCIYTAGSILFMTLAKLLGFRPVLKSYGEQKVIR
jgi:glycosyltransferase involved in cell wall biosynthesis